MNTLSAVVQQDPFESPRKKVVNDINNRKLRRPAFYKNSVSQKHRSFLLGEDTIDASQAETVRGNALMCLWLSPRRPQATGISYFLDCIVLYFCISVLYLWSCLQWVGGTGKSYLLCIVEPDLWGHGNIVAWWAAQEISNCLWLSTIPTISQIIIIFKTSSAFSACRACRFFHCHSCQQDQILVPGPTSKIYQQLPSNIVFRVIYCQKKVSAHVTLVI